MVWGKKAESNFWDIIFPTFQFLLVLAVFLMLGIYVQNLASGKTLEKNYYARDIALLVDTVNAAPGDVFYTYPNNLEKYELGIKIEENFVVIYDKDNPLGGLLGEK